MKVIKDYRGLAISKDGYQLDGITLLEDGVPRKFNFDDFQTISKAQAEKRALRHLRCIGQ